MHIAEVVTIAKSLPLLRLNTYKSLILSYSADYRRIFRKKKSIRYLCRKSWVKLPNTSRAPMTDANAAALKVADAGTTEPAKAATEIITNAGTAAKSPLRQRSRNNKKSGIYSAFFMSIRLSNPMVISARLYTELSGTRKVA